MTFETSLHEIASCTTQTDIWHSLQKEAVRLGMQGVSWVAQLPLPIEKPETVIYDNFSPAWHDRYLARNYLQIDPTVRHGLTSVRPLLWSDTQNEAPEFWEDARSFGLREGVAQSMWDRQGCVSMLSFSRDGVEFTTLELADKMPKICWLAHLAHVGMMQLILPEAVPESAADLTAREKETLKLAATGKTSQEISEALNVAKRTVDFHLDNATARLRAKNRTDAVLRAVVLGLI